MDLRATRAEINITQFKQNLLFFKKMIGNRPLCLAVKGNAYGHGLVTISLYAQELVGSLSVATVGEGIKLREAGVTCPILVMSSHLECEIPLICRYNLTPFISHEYYIDVYQKYAQDNKMILPVHLKIDTGMGRAGVMPDEALQIAQKITSMSDLYLEGICTHFAMADDTSSDYTKEQIQTFQQVITELQQNGINPPLIHAANSAGIVNYPNSYFTMARVGIGAYGYVEHEQVKPILSFKSKIVVIKTIPKGHTVSYGCTWEAKQQTTIGILPVGYADGYMRCLSNNSKVIIDGEFYPVIGRVCMDQIIIQLPDNAQSWLEKDVLLFGDNPSLNASTIATWANTISYEVLTSISDRVPRIYLG